MPERTSTTRTSSIPAPSGLERVAKVLRVVADPRRLRILAVLMRKELCVCELVDVLVLAQYEVSRHLARLKEVGLAADRRDGLWIYYSIPESAWQDSLLGGLLRLVEQETGSLSAGDADFARLANRLALRDGDRCVVGFQND